MKANRKVRLFTWAVLLFITSIALAGCGPTQGTPTPNYRTGDVQVDATATSGPLHLALSEVNYGGGYSGTQSGTTYIMQAKTTLSLSLTNNGKSTVILWNAIGGDLLGLPQSYYLVGDKGQRYRRTGLGTTSQIVDGGQAATPPPSSTEIYVVPPAKVLPGQTFGFQLVFEGIPADVTTLTLVMEEVKTEAGDAYTLRLPVPLSPPATPQKQSP